MAKAIREGDFDYQMEARLLFRGPLEMGTLPTFARMAEKINGQIRSLEKVNTTRWRRRGTLAIGATGQQGRNLGLESGDRRVGQSGSLSGDARLFSG